MPRATFFPSFWPGVPAGTAGLFWAGTTRVQPWQEVMKGERKNGLSVGNKGLRPVSGRPRPRPWRDQLRAASACQVRQGAFRLLRPDPGMPLENLPLVLEPTEFFDCLGVSLRTGRTDTGDGRGDLDRRALSRWPREPHVEAAPVPPAAGSGKGFARVSPFRPRGGPRRLARSPSPL